jgi:hypothetical protein
MKNIKIYYIIIKSMKDKHYSRKIFLPMKKIFLYFDEIFIYVD